MKLKQITLDKVGQQRVQELAEKLYKVCADESLPIVLVALATVKNSVQLASKVMTPEEGVELTKRYSEGGQACQRDNP